MAEDRKVIMRTTERVAMSHLETKSNLSHSSLSTRGTTVSAMSHLDMKSNLSHPSILSTRRRSEEVRIFSQIEKLNFPIF